MGRSNFDFLRDVWPVAHRNATDAETLVWTNPAAACNRARAAFETAHLRYRGLSAETPYHDRPPLGPFVGELRRTLGETDRVYRAAATLHAVGNTESHTTPQPTSQTDALGAVRDLFVVLRWLVVKLGLSAGLAIPDFDASRVPSRRLQAAREDVRDGLTTAVLDIAATHADPARRAAASTAVLEALSDRLAELADRHRLS